MSRKPGSKSVASVTTGKRQKLNTPESAWEKLWLARRAMERVRGKGILDMPGVDYDHKKLNWFLWKRGLLENDEERWGYPTSWKRPKPKNIESHDQSSPIS